MATTVGGGGGGGDGIRARFVLLKSSRDTLATRALFRHLGYAGLRLVEISQLWHKKCYYKLQPSTNHRPREVCGLRHLAQSHTF